MVKVAVVGGSIGGLTVACLLRDAGHDIEVFERSPVELEQRGAGIVCLDVTSRYLVERAGIPIGDITVETDVIRYLGRKNQVIHEQRHGYRFSSWTTIYRRLLNTFTRDRYRLGHDMSGWQSGDQKVELTFLDGSSDHADLLICADGVGSMSRQVLQPKAASGYAGYVAWRGMVHEGDLDPALASRFCEAITYYVTANSHILVYPIPGLDGSVKPGERLINFVWYRNYRDGDDLDDLLTDQQGQHRPLSIPPGLISKVHEDEARSVAIARLPDDMAELIQSVAEPFLQVVYDIEVKRMAFDRVCLLGDAAFVARPHAGAGSAKAADDGWALAAALQENSSVQEALQVWETSQLEVGRTLVDRARRIGRRSQIDNNWTPGDPDLLFGLHAPGD